MTTDIKVDLDMQILDLYKAKTDGTTLLSHINDTIKLAKQVKDIYSLDINTYISLCKCIIYHDLGKVTKHFQDNIDNTERLIRHEILSASIKGLLDSERLAVITHHKDLKTLEGKLKNVFYESELNEVADKLKVDTEDVRTFIRKVVRPNCKLTRGLDNILLKGYLQYCDHLSSAGIENIEYSFKAKDTYRYTSYNSIQTEILNLKNKEDILIIGPTGIGKTAASLYWSDIVQNKESSKRIYYLLPYIASINSLYKNMDDKGLSVAILHNKAEYFIGEFKEYENTKELYNLFKKSVKQINISTIYQIIKCIFSCKRFEMLLAQFKDSIFIVDEIHCFDMEQTALLINTLKFFKEKLNISICIMSASIPSKLQKLICTELGINKIIKASSDDYKVRHKLHRVNNDIFSAIDKIKEDLDNNKKVLLCVNTVNVAQELFTQLKDYNPTLIHGRMNTRDREKAEDNLKNCNLLIGTQAIEVSLDIDYDIMYTEIAPFDSLLQRLGRVNRYANKGISDIFIYNTTDTAYKFYEKDLIERTDDVINKIISECSSIVREEDVQHNLDYVYENLDFKNYYDKSEKVKKLISTLKVGVFNEDATDNMIDSNTITVLPISLKDEYKKLIEEGRTLEAKSLFVNIRYNKFISEHIKSAKEFSRKIDSFYITDLIYDDRGLVYEVDTNAFFI